MRNVTLAATKFAFSWDPKGQCRQSGSTGQSGGWSRSAGDPDSGVFRQASFCITQDAPHLALAAPFEAHPLIARSSDLALKLGVVLPVSYFEAAGQVRFNSVAMLDADGRILGRCRKSHIPQGPGYEEKYYFSPGDSGFRVWDTAFGRIGTGICWDQWFPEAARAMALMGAGILLYPTAVGPEPQTPGYDSQPHWEIVMRGQAGANFLPVVASNRNGTEVQDGQTLTFYGSSSIADPTGQLLTQAGRNDECILTATIDLAAAAELRRAWGLFRDRRPDLYSGLRSL